MTEEEFDEKFGEYELDEEYSDFILLHHVNDTGPNARIIENEGDLMDALESEYMFEEFKLSMVY
jgi:hypothetical protein